MATSCSKVNLTEEELCCSEEELTHSEEEEDFRFFEEEDHCGTEEEDHCETEEDESKLFFREELDLNSKEDELHVREEELN